MSKSIFNAVNTQIKTTLSDRFHLKQPLTPYKMIVDNQAVLHVFKTKREYFAYLDERDVELCRY